MSYTKTKYKPSMSHTRLVRRNPTNAINAALRKLGPDLRKKREAATKKRLRRSVLKPRGK